MRRRIVGGLFVLGIAAVVGCVAESDPAPSLNPQPLPPRNPPADDAKRADEEGDRGEVSPVRESASVSDGTPGTSGPGSSSGATSPDGGS